MPTLYAMKDADGLDYSSKFYGDKAEERSKRAIRTFLHFFLSLLVVSAGWYIWSSTNGNTVSSLAGLLIYSKGHRISVKNIDVNAFDWGRISPAKELKWIKCYKMFLCARIIVPLDYDDPTVGNASIAITKLPSKNAGSISYRGPVLFNPGGPGGSGVNLILGIGQQFRNILGDDFDIVGFDPRGTGFTKPGIEVFSSDAERDAWFIQDDFSLNTTVSSLGNAYARAQILGGLLHKKPDVNAAASYVTTPLVARDMLSIVNAHGMDKLLYWGFSYGTVLGATFAAMFPDKIERLVIDGVVDAENYYATLWSNNLRDTDTELMEMYEACVAAGPSACPIYEETASLVKERVDRLLEYLKLNPIAVIDPQTSRYGTIDSGIVKKGIFWTLYRPVVMARNLTIALAEAEKGNGLPMLNVLLKLFVFPTMPLSCSCKPELPVPFVEGDHTPFVAIACSDGDQVPADFDSITEYYSDLAESSMFAENWRARLACSGWHVQGKKRIDKNSISANETSHPILLIGNT